MSRPAGSWPSRCAPRPRRSAAGGSPGLAGGACGNWYGVRIAVDLEELDPPPPSDPRELAALLDVEERLGAAEPYRQLGPLAHLILRKPDTAATPDVPGRVSGSR